MEVRVDGMEVRVDGMEVRVEGTSSDASRICSARKSLPAHISTSSAASKASRLVVGYDLSGLVWVLDLSRPDEAVHEEREEGEREPEHAVLPRALGDLAWHTA